MSLDTLQPILQWLQLHPWLAIVFAFLISFVESIALVGLFIPGAVVLTAIGILIGAEIIPAISTMVAAIAGAFLGDVASFAYGRRYQEKVRNLSFFHKHITWLHAAEHFFHKHGGKGIFIARFMGPLRPIMPMVAGMFNMSWLRFCIVDIFSALLWAPAYMLPGIAVGAAAQTFNAQSATRLILFILLALAILWVSFWFIKKLYFFTIKKIHQFSQYLWDYHFSHYNVLNYFKIIDQPHNFAPLLYLSFIILYFSAFLLVAFYASYHQEYITININIWHFFRSLFNFEGQKIAILISLLFSPFSFGLLWVTLCIYFYYKNAFKILTLWFTLGCVTIGACGLIKIILNLPRPPGILQPPSQGAFPSGHVALAASFLPFLFYLVFQNQEKFIQQWANRICYCLIFILACCRLFLGVHWFTDVLSAFLLGFAIWLSIKLFLIKESTNSSQNFQLPSFISIIFLALFIGFIGQVPYRYALKQENYTPYWPDISLSATEWWQQGYKKLLYRHNRLGNPLQTLNVQWLSSPAKIEANLIAKGWKTLPTSKILTAMDYLNDTQQPKNPLVTGFFNDQKPILEMVKLDKSQNFQVVLRLWKSHIEVYHQHQPPRVLLVGLIFYHIQEPFHFKTLIPLHTSEYQHNMNPQRFLLQDLPPNFQWKFIPLKAKALNRTDDISWQGTLLLIQPIFS